MTLYIDDVEIDIAAMIDMLREAFQLGVANGIEYTLIGLNKSTSNGNTLRSSNAILAVTWGDKEWQARFIRHMLEVAREGKDK